MDYALREFKCWTNPEIVPYCLSSITAFNGKIVFNSKEAAFKFAENFLRCQSEHWGGPQAVTKYKLFSDLLELALEENIISKEDFFLDDEKIIKKLNKSKHEKIIEKINLLKNREMKLIIDKKNPDLKLQKKFCYVDPDFLENNNLLKLSSDKDFKELLQKHRENNLEGINVKIIV